MIVEQRDYHVFSGKLPELVRLYADVGIAMLQEVLGGFIGAFTTDIGALSTYTSMWGYASHAEREGRRAALQGRGFANIPQLTGLPQIVGLALGSPEFQRH